jgi:hypothetical protein
LSDLPLWRNWNTGHATARRVVVVGVPTELALGTERSASTDEESSPSAAA